MFIIPRVANHSARPVVQDNGTSAPLPNQALNPPFPDTPSARAEVADFRAEPPEHAADSGDDGDDEEIDWNVKIVTGCRDSFILWG